MPKEKSFYSEGLHFECTRCSRCCRFEPGYVFLSRSEITKIANFLRMDRKEFLKIYCRRVSIDGGVKISLKEKENYDCIFWNKGECSIYSERPLQCRAFPFWKTFLVSKESWENLEKSCPGVNRGKLYSKEYIEYWLDRESKEDYFIEDILETELL